MPLGSDLLAYGVLGILGLILFFVGLVLFGSLYVWLTRRRWHGGHWVPRRPDSN